MEIPLGQINHKGISGKQDSYVLKKEHFPQKNYPLGKKPEFALSHLTIIVKALLTLVS